MQIPGIRERIEQVFHELDSRLGGRPDCPICGNKDWTRVGDGRVIEIRTVREDDPTAAPLFTTALGLSCMHCGFLRFHEADTASWGMPAEGRGLRIAPRMMLRVYPAMRSRGRFANRNAKPSY